MDKNFTHWHAAKAKIDKRPFVDFSRREIWWCSIGINVGDEQDGKNAPFERPVLILRKFNRGLFLGIPMTSKSKHPDSPFYFDYDVASGGGSFILSQSRVLSSKRLNRKMGRVREATFDEIKQKYFALMA